MTGLAFRGGLQHSCLIWCIPVNLTDLYLFVPSKAMGWVYGWAMNELVISGLFAIDTAPCCFGRLLSLTKCVFMTTKFDGFDPEPAVFLLNRKLWLLCNIERTRQSETGQ